MNNTVMHEPGLFGLLLQEYFSLIEMENSHPTIPGMALAVGFNRTKDISEALEKWDKNESTYPRESIMMVIRAVTKIEDHILTHGLKSTIPASIAKFTLGAYHGVQEPSSGNQEVNNAIQIVFEEPDKAHQITVKSASLDSIKSSGVKQVSMNDTIDLDI